MILIADSGSTKTNWCLAGEEGAIRRIDTVGINPYFQTEDEIASIVENHLARHLQGMRPDAIYFYGAGCAFDDKIDMVKNAITRHIATKHIEIGSDMLGAARALCGHRPGIACILGTGSNSCYYDGNRIMDNVSPLGFILGDEGSGAHLGKTLTGDLLKNQMTPQLKEQFLESLGLTPAEIIDRVYRRPFPNRFLASMSPFIAAHIDQPCIRKMVHDSFMAFIRRNVMQYDYTHHTVHFTGSIASHYREILEEVCREMHISTGTIVQSPMNGLIEYHTQI